MRSRASSAAPTNGDVVDGKGEWTGIITIEDVLEELVGKIGDEFDPERAEPSISLADALSPGRVVFNLRAESMPDAIQHNRSRYTAGRTPRRPANHH